MSGVTFSVAAGRRHPPKATEPARNTGPQAALPPGFEAVQLKKSANPRASGEGDSDAATWLPPSKPYRCEYVARQVAVKARYELWVTTVERDAIARIFADCPGQLVSAAEAGRADR
jgi:hypothetical protein